MKRLLHALPLLAAPFLFACYKDDKPAKAERSKPPVDATKRAKSSKPKPPIDDDVPAILETATFALG
jgi:hypothetical protein